MNDLVINEDIIKNKIYNIRGVQVMLDRDLAEIYGVETRVINQAVKRNIDRFDEEIFMFKLTDKELNVWKSQIVISNSVKMGLRKKPYVFTEQGIYMLATVLKSKTAVDTTKQIMKTFVNIRQFISQNTSLFQKINTVEYKVLNNENKINKIFDMIGFKELPIQGIFYNGQIYDAYVFVNDLLKDTKSEVVLIDNYIDDTVLTIFSKYPNLKFVIITNKISKQCKLDIDKYNAQYKNLMIKTSSKFHDRFLVIDNKKAYHIGASLKDLGKKVFGFSEIDVGLLEQTLCSLD